MYRLFLSAVIIVARKFSIFRLKWYISFKNTKYVEMFLKKNTIKLINKIFHRKFLFSKVIFLSNLITIQYKYFITYSIIKKRMCIYVYMCVCAYMSLPPHSLALSFSLSLELCKIFSPKRKKIYFSSFENLQILSFNNKFLF